MNIGKLAKGRWPGILAQLGIDTKYLTGRHGPCPMCRGRDRFRFDDKGEGMWICAKCGAGDGFKLLMEVNGWDFKKAAQEVEPLINSTPVVPTARERSEADLRRSMNHVWKGSKPVTYGDQVSSYLANRGIHLETYPNALRYSESCKRGPEEWYPAMLAKVHDKDGEPVNVHRTFLAKDGSGNKADVEDARRMMAGKVPKGSAIRLASLGESKTLGIAEGIETALAAMSLFGIPTWSVVNTYGMMSFEPPPGVESVVIFGDNDQSFAGQAAAYSLAYALANGRKKYEVKVMMPDFVGYDWNDVLKETIIGQADPS